MKGDIEYKIIPYEKLADIRNGMSINIRLGVSNGCFDILGYHHAKFLEEAKAKCNWLIIGLNCDKSVSNLKPGRPINNENERAYVLASLKVVDYVCIFPEDNFCNFIEKSRPHVYIKTEEYDYKNKYKNEYDSLIKVGGKLTILDYIEGKSTTKTIEKIKK